MTGVQTCALPIFVSRMRWKSHVRLPMPPVRPVRETFTSYGSRQRDMMGRVHFASSMVHSPWTALRVRWVPVYCFPTLSLRPFALYVALLGRHRARCLTVRLPMVAIGRALQPFPHSKRSRHVSAHSAFQLGLSTREGRMRRYRRKGAPASEDCHLPSSLHPLTSLLTGLP